MTKHVEGLFDAGLLKRDYQKNRKRRGKATATGRGLQWSLRSQGQSASSLPGEGNQNETTKPYTPAPSHLSDLRHRLLLAHSTPAMMPSLFLLRHIRCVPSSDPLLSMPPPYILSWPTLSSIHGFAQLSSSQQVLNLDTILKMVASHSPGTSPPCTLHFPSCLTQSNMQYNISLFLVFMSKALQELRYSVPLPSPH